jgi:hypothetical protein
LTPEEEAANLAAMYAQDEDEDDLNQSEAAGRVHPLIRDVEHENEAPQSPIQIAAQGRYISITVNGAKLMLPSVSFVNELETVVKLQAKQILQLKSQVRQAREIINNHGKDLNEVWRDLDRKLNGRDL